MKISNGPFGLGWGSRTHPRAMTPTPTPTPAPGPTPTPTPAPSPVAFTPTHIWDFEPTPGFESEYIVDRMDPDSQFAEWRSLLHWNRSEISNEWSAHGSYSGKVIDDIDATGFFMNFYRSPTLIFDGDFSVEMFIKSNGTSGKRLSSLLSSGSTRFGIAGDLAATPGGLVKPTTETQFAGRLCVDLNVGAAPHFFGLNQAVQPGEKTYVALFRKDGLLNVKLNSTVGTPLAFTGRIDFVENDWILIGGDHSEEPEMALSGFIDSIRVCSTSCAVPTVNSPAPIGPFTP